MRFDVSTSRLARIGLAPCCDALPGAKTVAKVNFGGCERTRRNPSAFRLADPAGPVYHHPGLVRAAAALLLAPGARRIPRQPPNGGRDPCFGDRAQPQTR